MLDVLVVFLVVTLMALTAGAVLVWDGRRRLKHRFQRSAERALDDLAADTCDGLSYGDDAGGNGRHTRSVRRYERVRDDVRSARTVRDLGRAAARAEAHRMTARAEAGLRALRLRAARRTAGKPPTA